MWLSDEATEYHASRTISASKKNNNCPFYTTVPAHEYDSVAFVLTRITQIEKE